MTEAGCVSGDVRLEEAETHCYDSHQDLPALQELVVWIE